MRRLPAVLTALLVLAASTIVGASPAFAVDRGNSPSSYSPGAPTFSSNVWYGWCNSIIEYDGPDTTAHPAAWDIACQYKLPNGTKLSDVGNAGQSGGIGTWQMNWGAGGTSSAGSAASLRLPLPGATFTSSDSCFKVGTTSDTGTQLRFTVIGWPSGCGFAGGSEAWNSDGWINRNGSIQMCVATYGCIQLWAGAGSSTKQATTYTGTSVMPTDFFTGGGLEVHLAACTFTSDLPSNGTLTTGQAVHVTITYSDGTIPPDTTTTHNVSVISAALGEVPTPINPNPPDAVWQNAARTTSPQAITIIADHAGTWFLSARCDFSDGARITAGSAGPSTSDFCAANPTVAGCSTASTRPDISDCLPSTSGGLFGILGTVLDPNTYVRATVCMAKALFQPGPSTLSGLQTLWTDVQTHAPFSYVTSALTFLPDAFGGLQSGIGSGGGCPNITAGGNAAWTNPTGTTGSGACLLAGANTGANSQLGIIRLIILALFAVSIGTAVVKSTLRIVN